VGVLYRSGSSFGGGTGGRESKDRELLPEESWTVRKVGDSILSAPSLVGLDDWFSKRDSALARSSHFPRTASRLLPTRWDGAHLRVVAGVEEDPVVLLNMLPVDRELLRESDPPLPRDDVRSSRRVWYAKGPVEEARFTDPVEVVDDIEFERSIS